VTAQDFCVFAPSHTDFVRARFLSKKYFHRVFDA